MFAKIRKGDGFGGCLDYITRVKQDSLPPEKRVWRIIGSDGVRLDTDEQGWRNKAASDIERPTLTRAKTRNPCGHIALGFAPEDSDRLTDEFMLQLANEYMERVGIRNTPYIIVRHTDKDHPHCHIMLSAVDYDGKIIRDFNNFYKNGHVCLDLTEKHNLTIAKDSLSLDTYKLRGAEKSRVEIRQIAHAVLQDKGITDWPTFHDRMMGHGITVTMLWDDSKGEKKLKTLIYKKGNHSFVASKIGKDCTPKGLSAIFKTNRKPQMNQAAAAAQASTNPTSASQSGSPVITLSTPTLGTPPPNDACTPLGAGLPDDFKQFLENHPGMDIIDAWRLFARQQKEKAKARQRTKLHM